MILKEFQNPPKKYGEVSFFWWHGDKIEKEKLHWILEQLKGKEITGLQLNYCHSDQGGLQYGLTMDSDPKPFSDEWWKLLEWLLEECKKYDMSISLSDYTLGAPGQGSYMDAVLEKHPEFIGQKLVWENGKVQIKKVPFSANPMAKGIGKAIADEFYGAFERHFPGECGKHINYFFSDELNFNIRGNLWSDDFCEEFQARKGYDFTLKWEAIFNDIGPETPKIRLDYYDVIVQLSEEEYFRPIYEWHENRGMTFGCDHGGRGQDVTEFGDYFRTMKWNQGPGNDQPHLASNIIKSKVSSSISHLYQRPRVWLEGFYSSGWQTSSADVADAVFRNFGLGHNLLSLHGLYYSTHGSMWEWAPPCNHYHMPYWGEMGTLLACTQRLSYLLAQGVHQCDAAIVYPVAAVEADAIQGKHSVETAFAVGRKLYQEGIDFDFIDFESLDRAEMKEGNAWVSGERYQYLILPDMANVRFSMMESLLGFVENGGKLIILGKLPQGSDRTGRNDKKLRELCDILKEKGKSVTTAEQVVEYIQGEGRLDFSAECSKEVFYQHRNENGRDYYYIYGVEKGCKCRFRADGIPVLLNPWSGKRMRLTDFESKEGITEISFPLTSYDPTIIAFEENSSEALELPDFKMKSEKILDINGEWECQIIPTMDNQYGDYRLPASDDFIGPEAREAFYCISEEDMRNQVSDAAWKSEWLTYGVYYWVCHNNINKENVFIKMEKPSDEFSPRVCSMKYGVKGDAGYQGSYHGLKGKLSDEFITLGEKKVLQAGSDSIYEGEGNYYVFMIFHSQNEMYANIQTGTLKPDAIWLNHKPVTGDVVTLKQGENYVLLRYGKSGRTYFMLEKDHKFTQELPLVTKWYQNTDILLSDPMPDLERKTCWLRFTSPPGMRGIRLLSHGDTRVFVGEKELEYKDGVYWSDKVFANSETVYVKICQEKGFYGCNAILEPVRFVLERGRVKLPLDWEREGLKFYSGGIRLIRKYYVQNTECVKLCVPGIASAVHVKVNGVDACSLVAEPYEGDLSRYLSKGENTIELFCYNTMHNHMLTVPTNFNFDKSPDWRQES